MLSFFLAKSKNDACESYVYMVIDWVKSFVYFSGYAQIINCKCFLKFLCIANIFIVMNTDFIILLLPHVFIQHVYAMQVMLAYVFFAHEIYTVNYSFLTGYFSINNLYKNLDFELFEPYLPCRLYYHIIIPQVIWNIFLVYTSILTLITQ